MLDRENHLLLADQHIVDARMQIWRQLERVQRLRAAGADVTQSEILLQTMQEVLMSFEIHRQQIEKADQFNHSLHWRIA